MSSGMLTFFHLSGYNQRLLDPKSRSLSAYYVHRTCNTRKRVPAVGPEFYSQPPLQILGRGAVEGASHRSGFGERSLRHPAFEGGEHPAFRTIMCESWTGKEL